MIAEVKTPKGGWLGLMVQIGQESKSEYEFDTRLAEALKDFAVCDPVRVLLERYDWKSAKRAAFCSPSIRIMVERDLLQNVCEFCQETIPDVEPCPLCGKRACVDHGSIIYFKSGGTEEEYLWACDECLHEMPDGGEGHCFECEGCGDSDNGCAIYQRLDAEYDRVMAPIFAAWERGESVLGLHRQEPHG